MPRSRRRPRAPRLSRMDAAVDAMLAYGFPQDKVKKRVKQLLKEYGGDVGWPFIEEYSYKVLLDSILDEGDDQEQVGQNGDLLEGTTCGSEEPECSSQASERDMDPSYNVSSSATVAEPTCDGPSSVAAETMSNDDGLPEELPAAAPSSSRDSTAMPLPRNKGPRVPCYGWIEEGDEANVFVALKPAPAALVAQGTVDLTKWRKKQRSRWDLKPTDP